MARGKLRLYLGAAPGVGKTYAMLNEGWRRKERGTDVVDRLGPGARPPPDRRPDPRSGDLPAPDSRVPWPDLRGDGRRRICWRASQSWCWSTSWPTPTCPGSKHAKRWQDVEDLLDAGHQRDLHRQSPAPRVAQRRGRADHRGDPAGDGPRPGGAGRRPDGAGRHGPRGAAPTTGPRQRLPPGTHRRRPRELLPHRKPHRAAGAGPAVGGRPGRRGAQRLPRAPQHRRTVGDQGAGGGVAHRLPRAAPCSSDGPPAWPCGPRPSWSGSTSAPTTA